MPEMLQMRFSLGTWFLARVADAAWQVCVVGRGGEGSDTHAESRGVAMGRGEADTPLLVTAHPLVPGARIATKQHSKPDRPALRGPSRAWDRDLGHVEVLPRPGESVPLLGQ